MTTTRNTQITVPTQFTATHLKVRAAHRETVTGLLALAAVNGATVEAEGHHGLFSTTYDFIEITGEDAVVAAVATQLIALS